MSYSWRLSRGTGSLDAPDVTGAGGSSSSSSSSSASSSDTSQHLGSAAVDKPLTPPSVRNVTPSICLSIVQFRALLQEYRSLDDLVTTRLNRSMANSRTQGLTSSPSILSGHVPSVSSTDLGKSTYARAPEQACMAFWKELVSVWIGREEVLEYCIEVERRERRAQQQARGAPSTSQAPLRSEAWLLDNDIGRQEREAQMSGRRDPYASPPALEPRKPSKAKYDAFDSRSSRSENSSDALRRQLNNELAIETILRKRSLDVFKSRCRFFTPIYSEGKRGEQERAMWEGSDTQAGQQARQTSASL